MATDVWANLSGNVKVTYALLSNADGYVLVCPTDPCQQNARQVPFGNTVAVTIGGKGTRDNYRAIKTAVNDSLDDLQTDDFKFVVMAFVDKPGSKTVVLGYSIQDWLKWGTYRQPSNPNLGLMTNENIQKSFKAV